MGKKRKPLFPHDMKVIALEGMEGVEEVLEASLESIRDLKARLDNTPLPARPKWDSVQYIVYVFDPTGVCRCYWRSWKPGSWEKFDAGRAVLRWFGR